MKIILALTECTGDHYNYTIVFKYYISTKLFTHKLNLSIFLNLEQINNVLEDKIYSITNIFNAKCLKINNENTAPLSSGYP